MTFTELVVAALLAVGIAGIIVPVIPGLLLLVGGLLLWAIDLNTSTGWVVVAIALGFLAIGTIVKYVVPGRRLKAAGVPRSTLVVGGVVGIVGFFVVPVVGLFIGFVLGVYAAERRRLGAAAAGPATRHALRAVGLSIVIELTASLLAVATWIVGIVVTG
ncbi:MULTISPECIES: DUF456 domain-containing protein [Nocardioides]|uniref:DUF456 domain-containing protein n=1 Tax=Nocardioides TaxID=1839 RepID=UPI00032FA8DC|nr:MULTISPECIES: DUF456 domain-containing protein [Nocardioides]EON23510.1 hypothetical protein CF8_2546 [Nocardioides sp. CF8]